MRTAWTCASSGRYPEPDSSPDRPSTRRRSRCTSSVSEVLSLNSRTSSLSTWPQNARTCSSSSPRRPRRAGGKVTAWTASGVSLWSIPAITGMARSNRQSPPRRRDEQIASCILLLAGYVSQATHGWRESRCELPGGGSPDRLSSPHHWRHTGPAGPGSAHRSAADDGVDERVRLERRQVVGTLAEADQLHRHAELALHRDDDPALGRPVELGEHDPGNVDGLGEHPRLAQPVLAGRGIKHEQDLVHGGVPRDHPLDLAKLVHEAGLRVQAPGRIHDDDVDAALDALVDRVERHARRVSAVAARADNLGAHALAPRLELVRGRGAERVRRAEQHALA